MAGYLLVLFCVHELPLIDRIYNFSNRLATVNLENFFGHSGIFPVQIRTNPSVCAAFLKMKKAWVKPRPLQKESMEIDYSVWSVGAALNEQLGLVSTGPVV